MSNYEEDFFEDENVDDSLPSNWFYNSIIVFALMGVAVFVVSIGYALYWLLFL